MEDSLRHGSEDTGTAGDPYPASVAAVRRVLSAAFEATGRLSDPHHQNQLSAEDAAFRELTNQGGK